jgi:hypothetical protein
MQCNAKGYRQRAVSVLHVLTRSLMTRIADSRKRELLDGSLREMNVVDI